jgi:hypothetical protein
MKQTTAQAAKQAQGQNGIATRFQPGQSGNPGGARTALERGRIKAVERQRIVADLITELGHKPSRSELMLIEAAAAQSQEGAELRRRDKSSAEPDRLLARILTKLNLGPREPSRASESYSDLATRVGQDAAARRAHELAADDHPHLPLALTGESPTGTVSASEEDRS